MEHPGGILLLADVVLPLPLAETYTYRIPDWLSQRAQVGCRLVVPFGSKKIYSAIIVALYEKETSSLCGEGMERTLKDAIDLLDEAPVLLPDQLWLWRWIADYYLCTLGEVFKAALPSGMKLESESLVEFNPDYGDASPLTPVEQYVYDLMERLRKQKISELQKSIHDGFRSNPLRVIKSLFDKGALIMHEQLQRNYRPKTVHCVRLSETFFDKNRLNNLHEELRRAPKQADLLTRYLALSKASAALTLENPSLLMETEKSILMEGHSEAALKGLLRRGVLEVYEKQVSRLPTPLRGETMEKRPTLSPAQQQACDQIRAAFLDHSTCLLHGVTGSGKTEIYIHLIQEQLEQGRQVLYMLPEIVLTAQLVERLRRVFGSRLGVYHSKYPDAERVEVWQKQLSPQPYDIIVGVRSSVFLPFQRLGLVVIDEEHETSFKQQDPAPRYHARNVALVLAQHTQAKTLLGTATPSLESYHNAQTGRYALVTLGTRFGQTLLPQIQVVDIRQQRHRKEMKGAFSLPLLRAMREALERREQIILFQNRRGYAPQIECQTCGWNPRCTRCDVALTLHKSGRQLVCHYCGATYPLPPRCPNCESHDLRSLGYGTERIEDEIQRIFPQSRVARMDLDTTRSRQAYEQLLSDFQHGHTDILVGTQMVTKGLDFERVSVVGILNADTMLNQPDFRSHERAFQLLSQVAGRAGRRQHQGLVILQTKSPQHSVVQQVVNNDFPSLYRDQMSERQAFHYPPFTRLFGIVVKHRDALVADRLSLELAALLRQVFGARVLGPDTPAVGRVQSLYIRRLLLKVEVRASMAEARLRLRQIQAHLLSQPPYRSAQVYCDVDPV